MRCAQKHSRQQRKKNVFTSDNMHTHLSKINSNLIIVIFLYTKYYYNAHRHMRAHRYFYSY